MVRKIAPAGRFSKASWPTATARALAKSRAEAAAVDDGARRDRLVQAGAVLAVGIGAVILVRDGDGEVAGDLAGLGLVVGHPVVAVLDHGEVLEKVGLGVALAEQVADRLGRGVGAAAGGVDHDLGRLRGAGGLLDRVDDVAGERGGGVAEFAPRRGMEVPGAQAALVAGEQIEVLPARGQVVHRLEAVLLEEGVVGGRPLVAPDVAIAVVGAEHRRRGAGRVRHVVLAAVLGVAEDDAADPHVIAALGGGAGLGGADQHREVVVGVPVSIVA